MKNRQLRRWVNPLMALCLGWTVHWGAIAETETETVPAARISTALGFTEVVSRALRSSPALDSRQAAISAALGRAEQAGYRPNPRLNLNVEDLIGSGPFDGFSRSEITLSYQQRFERGGKREARMRLAAQDQRLAEAARETEMVDLILGVERQYRQVQALQAMVQARQEQRVLTRAVRDVVKERRERGRDSDVALDNAEIRLLLAMANERQAHDDLNAAKSALAVWWQAAASNHDAAVDFVLEMETFYQVPAAADIARFDDVSANPDVRVWQVRQERSSAQATLERARSFQDPTISAGLRYIQESQDVAVVTGVSFPLAMNNNNQGNLQAARAQVEQARFAMDDAVLNLTRQLKRLDGEVRSAASLAINLREQLLARAAHAEQAVLERLRMGAASDLDVYAAQSLAAELRLQLIHTIERFHLTQAQRYRLSGNYLAQRPQWLVDQVEIAAEGAMK